MTSDLNRLLAGYVPQIEAEMMRVLAFVDDGLVTPHYGMLRYHMGWVDEHFRPQQVDGGKRIRPVLCLLACKAAGGTVGQALPAAAALELLHNFSLIHDDIQDESPLRRHRPTVWALWGRAQAINAGDAMFTLAHLALHGLSQAGLPVERVLGAMRAFDEACVRLTEGQFLDMSFEQRLDVTTEEYMTMIGGKTAALLGASLRLGALIAGASSEEQQLLGDFGHGMGIAFQVQDDILGIWGDEALTGKSVQSDILTRKKSLPVVYGLQHPIAGPQLRALYAQPLGVDEVTQVLDLLEQVGAEAYAEAEMRSAHHQALAALQASRVWAVDAEDAKSAGQALFQIAEALLDRKR